jgi:3-oxoacyl-[acyl-carrier protein] reductase
MSTFLPISDLNGHVVVIAGGLGAIGFETAKRLSTLGATCVLLHREKPGAAEKLKSLDASQGQRHMNYVVDLSHSVAIKKIADDVFEQFGRCDLLVNSAGYTKPVPAADLESLTDELIDAVLVSNFRSVIATIRCFLPLLKKSEAGLIVNVSSISAFTGVGSNLAYVAAKAGLDVVGDALAKVLAPSVRVVSVSPGAVESNFVPGRGQDFAEKMATTTPLGRIGLPQDVAVTIEALATQMRFVTGTRIVVDGGRHL